jgi:hypothetical protein
VHSSLRSRAYSLCRCAHARIVYITPLIRSAHVAAHIHYVHICSFTTRCARVHYITPLRCALSRFTRLRCTSLRSYSLSCLRSLHNRCAHISLAIYSYVRCALIFVCALLAHSVAALHRVLVFLSRCARLCLSRLKTRLVFDSCQSLFAALI